MQIISLFNCQMRDGRATSAPLLKRAQGETVALAQTETTTTDYHICSNKLPHQFSREERQKRFMTAVPTDEPYGETDQTPEAELADPVPLLERRLWDSPQSRVTSKLRRGGCTFKGCTRQTTEVAGNPRCLTAAQDVEKAAAEVPSRANASERASAGSNDSLTAVVEYETSRTNSFLTTLCGNRDTDPARAVGGCPGMQVRNGRRFH